MNVNHINQETTANLKKLHSKRLGFLLKVNTFVENINIVSHLGNI